MARPRGGERWELHTGVRVREQWPDALCGSVEGGVGGSHLPCSNHRRRGDGRRLHLKGPGYGHRGGGSAGCARASGPQPREDRLQLMTRVYECGRTVCERRSGCVHARYGEADKREGCGWPLSGRLLDIEDAGTGCPSPPPVRARRPGFPTVHRRRWARRIAGPPVAAAQETAFEHSQRRGAKHVSFSYST